MFYQTDQAHGLRYNPFKSCIVPRPIAWISTCSQASIVNLAPYSYFTAVSDLPPVILFSSTQKPNGERKDTIRNIISTKEFVVNLCPSFLKEVMNETSQAFPYEKSEVEYCHLEMVPSRIVTPPRLKLSPIALECRCIGIQTPQVDGESVSAEVVFGHVVGIYIDDSVIEDGKVTLLKISPLARLGYDEYTAVDHLFRMVRR